PETVTPMGRCTTSRSSTTMGPMLPSANAFIKAVVFDMDGVLCDYQIERRLALLAAWSGRSADAIHAAIWRSGFEDDAERGAISADDYLKGFGERMGYPLTAAQWIEARKVATEPNPAVLSLARQLGRDRVIGMLTNNPWLLKRH